MKQIIFGIFGLLAAVSLFAQSDLQNVAAIVNIIRPEPITVSQFRIEVERMERTTGRILTQDERFQVLNDIINEKLILQAAERDGVIITDDELTHHLQQVGSGMVQQIGRQFTDDEFTQFIMNLSGLSVEDFKEHLRNQLIIQKYLILKSSILSNISRPTEEEITTEYNLIKHLLVRPETIRVFIIQVPYGPNAASRTAARIFIDRLSEEIDFNPIKFDEVAARSVEPNSGYQAGYLGYLSRNVEANARNQEFIKFAFSLQQDQISSVIDSGLGFQIIKIKEKYDFKYLELDDIIQLGSTITVREYLEQIVLNKKQQAAFTQAKQELITDLRITGRTFQIIESNLNW